ncbi:MAG: acyl carrier protein [Paludibacter sp.]|nr:acyl carrier protein [Paludibacter sp.]
MEAKFLLKFKEVLEISDRELQLEDNFREYEEWNSLVFLSLIAMIDEEFDVIIEGKEFKLLKTNADIIAAIKNA